MYHNISGLVKYGQLGTWNQNVCNPNIQPQIVIPKNTNHKTPNTKTYFQNGHFWLVFPPIPSPPLKWCPWICLLGLFICYQLAITQFHISVNTFIRQGDCLTTPMYLSGCAAITGMSQCENSSLIVWVRGTKTQDSANIMWHYISHDIDFARDQWSFGLELITWYLHNALIG